MYPHVVYRFDINVETDHLFHSSIFFTGAMRIPGIRIINLGRSCLGWAVLDTGATHTVADNPDRKSQSGRQQPSNSPMVRTTPMAGN